MLSAARKAQHEAAHFKATVALNRTCPRQSHVDPCFKPCIPTSSWRRGPCTNSRKESLPLRISTERGKHERLTPGSDVLATGQVLCCYMRVCMCVCMYICVYAYAYMSVYVSMHFRRYVPTCIRVYDSIRVCVFICVYAYMCISIYVYMYISTCMSAYLYICMYVYICTYIYICVHTHLYIYTSV